MTVLQIVILFFIAMVLSIAAIYMWYMAVKESPRYELRRRLRRLALDVENRRFPEELRLEILGEMSRTDRALLSIRPLKRLDILIDKAGLRMDLKAFLLVMLATALVGFFLGLLPHRGFLIPVVFAVVGVFLPILFLRGKKNSRLKRFTEQFPDTLEMISRSLKAGHSFTAAMQLVAQEMADPMSTLFKAAYDEQALGVSTRESIAHMTERIESTDLRFFVMAINIHREIGGNLGEILERLAKTIRERLTIRRQVRVYTAQARLSGYILAVVPVFMAFLFYFMTPGYIEELLDVDIGRYAIALAISAQIVGFLVIRRIINIRI
jgi:tight adherence protein B